MDSEELDGRVIQPFFTGMLINDLNGQIKAFETDKNIIFDISLPIDH